MSQAPCMKGSVQVSVGNPVLLLIFVKSASTHDAHAASLPSELSKYQLLLY